MRAQRSAVAGLLLSGEQDIQCDSWNWGQRSGLEIQIWELSVQRQRAHFVSLPHCKKMMCNHF